MAVTAVVGLMVTEETGFARHFLLGLMTGFYTCLVHIVVFMYFAVSGKIIEQAVRAGQTERDTLGRVIDLKAKAVRTGAIGMVAILIVIGLGGAAGGLVSPTVHMIAAFSAVLVNSIVFLYQFGLIDRNRRMFDETFERAPSRSPAFDHVER